MTFIFVTLDLKVTGIEVDQPPLLSSEAEWWVEFSTMALPLHLSHLPLPLPLPL